MMQVEEDRYWEYEHARVGDEISMPCLYFEFHIFNFKKMF